MKLISYSDLHLEFDHKWQLPETISGDILILAGDIITFQNYSPLQKLLTRWDKPVIYVSGNHEYYNSKTSMNSADNAFRDWLSINLPQVSFLSNECTSINNINFFGGTMWTDFSKGNIRAMHHAHRTMNDFKLIYTGAGERLTPEYTIELHQRFTTCLIDWFNQKPTGNRVVVSHHAPVINKDSHYQNSPLIPAFNSLDMLNIIEEHQPDYWIYGHTHECDEQIIGKTKIISNQLGYPNGLGGFQCLNFDPNGKSLRIKNQAN
jgi:predicted phosphodiesterase